MELPPSPGKTPALVDATARPKIHAITSVRFFAALYVVLFHTKWGVVPGSLLDRFLDLGYIAPNFFFLLSGYILAIVYLRRGTNVPAKKFYIARFARIYPLYLVSVLADVPFVIGARIAKYGLKAAFERVMILLAASTVMMQMWMPPAMVINIPSWSLAIEAVFYLAFPFLGPWLWRAGERAVLTGSIVLYVVGVILNWLVNRHRTEVPSGYDLISFMAVFSLGIVLARSQTLQAEKQRTARTSGRTGWVILTASAAFFVAVIWINPWLRVIGVNAAFLLVPAYMGLIWILVTTRIAPVRFLEVKWLIVLGEASYGLYLIQAPVLHLFIRLHLAGSAKGYPLYLGSCIALSVTSFYFFETPARRWILHRFHSFSKETIEAASAAQ